MSNILLQIKNLQKSYGETAVLKGISLDVHKGEVIVIIGPSGCGKSTLLRCMNGLESIQGGEIVFNGNVISGNKTDWQKVRQQIGMVFQSYDLFPNMTVLQNVILGPIKVQKRSKQDAIEAADKLLSRVGLLDKKDAYPRELSGGQKQRAAIVRSLILEPEIILFDEVTAALDPEMVREVLDVMLELAKGGSTMLIVTHEMQFAKAVADRILFIDEGKVTEEASPEEFFTNPKTERAKKFLNIFNFDEKKEVLS